MLNQSKYIIDLERLGIVFLSELKELIKYNNSEYQSPYEYENLINNIYKELNIQILEAISIDESNFAFNLLSLPRLYQQHFNIPVYNEHTVSSLSNRFKEYALGLYFKLRQYIPNFSINSNYQLEVLTNSYIVVLRTIQ